MGILDKVKSKFAERSGNSGGSSDDPNAAAAQRLPPPPPSPPLGPESVFRYRQQKGINLGAWFSSEQWIAGAPFKHVEGWEKSDYDIVNAANAQAAYEQHWDSWVSDEDWQWIVKQGFNAVRLPIGYYHLAAAEPAALMGTDYEPFADVFAGAWQRIQAAIATAGEHGLGVLVDLHGAPGAQNPDAHAGLSKKSVGLWNGNNQKATIVALRFLASYLAPIPHVIGLELLNEPKDSPNLEAFYNKAIAACREVVGPDFPLYVHDAFRPDYYAGYIPKQNTFVVLDHHLYRCFTDEDRNQSGDQHAQHLTGDFGTTFAGYSDMAHGSIIVGEFSACLDDKSFGNTHDDDERNRHRRVFLRAQLDLYDKYCAGFFFWTLKKGEGWDANWSAKNATQAEILPAWVGGKRYQGNGEDRKGELIKQAYDSHVDFWNKQGGDYEHDRFAAGLEQGWNDAQIFFNFKAGPSEATAQMGFVHEWMLRRRVEHVQARGDSGFVWEFEHGFKQGVKLAAQACLA